MTLHELRILATRQNDRTGMAIVDLLCKEPLPAPPATERDKHNYATLVCFWKVLEEKGCGLTTPAEELLWSLVHTHMYGPLTPERIKGDVDDFNSNFEEAVWTAQKMAAEYPKEFASVE